MKTAKRRILSLLMATLMLLTSICGHVDFAAAAVAESSVYDPVTENMITDGISTLADTNTASGGAINTPVTSGGSINTPVTSGGGITAPVGPIGKITSAEQFTTGTYTMIVETGYAPAAIDGGWVLSEKPTLVGNQVSNHKSAYYVITVNGSTVKLQDANGKYISPSGGNNNGIKEGEYDWTWEFDVTTGTFQFKGQGSDTVIFASNTDPNSGGNKFRAYKNATVLGNPSTYLCAFTLFGVDPNAKVETEVTLKEGSKVVIYNINAEGVLGAQNDTESINSVVATVENGVATVENGGVIFEIKKNEEYYRFYNETYGYLASNGTGNNAFYTKEASEDADWKLTTRDNAYIMESRTAKYNDKYSQYLEYFSESYKTYSMYNVTDYSIYEFLFLPCAENTTVTGGIVNKPTAVVKNLLDANVGSDYVFEFEVDAPFGVKELAVTVNNEAVTYTEASGVYTVIVPAEKVVGENLAIVVSGKDAKEVTFTKEFIVTIKDEPEVTNVSPAAGSETLENKKPVISADIVNAGEKAVVTMTVNGEEVAVVYADNKVTYTPATDMPDGRYSVTVTVTRADGKTASKTWSFSVGEATYQLYFGQLHSHTTYSDGSGTLESALDYVKGLPESANVDFVAFTDHSNYFDTKENVNPEAAIYNMELASPDSQKTWKEYKETVAKFNAAQSDVVAIGGFEMTWSGGPGHINTFNTPGIVSRNNATLNNKTDNAGLKAYYTLLSQPEGADSLTQLNHPGSTFGTFADFAYWDAVIDSRVFLVEVGNGEGQVGAGGYFPSYEYYTMALDKGWHLAPTNNQDNHKGKWGNANDARDVILTDDFSEKGLYEAIRAMRVYATEDKNLEVYYTVNDLQLGSTIKEKPEDPLKIKVSVYDPDATDSISKVEVIVNSGKTAYTWDNPEVLAKGELTCELAPDYSYYYIRVTESDGDLAVTSPVWVGETLKLGISSVECGTSIPVTGEELTLTTTVFNSEAADTTVKALTYTTDGGKVIGAITEPATISAYGTKAIDFKFTPDVAKLTKITVTVVLEKDGIEYTFTKDITLDVQDAGKLAYIGIDAAHFNEYVSGNYKDSMGNFSKLAAGQSVRTVELKDCASLIEACKNEKFKAIILTAPSRRLNDSWTDPRAYSSEEIAALVEFNKNGGTLIFSSWSDHYESPSKTGNNTGIPFKHMSETQNEVLEALGSSLRVNDDATYDKEHNGGQEYRLYFNTYGKNLLTEGVEVDPEHLHDRLYTEVFSHYGGASIYAVNKDGSVAATLPETVSPVVFGHPSTYSVDVDEDGKGGTDAPKYAYAEGDDRLMIMAMEELEGQGMIIVAGAAFMSNFEVQATIEDSVAEKNYSNYKICENLVEYINPAVITPIAEVQAQTGVGYKYTIEGVVTTNASGYDKDTAFFDCIYVQDATGGVCCFPVAGNYKIGDKVRVTGTTDFYQGEMELQVSEIELIGSGEVTPKTVTAAQLNNLSVLGQLIKLEGTVVSYEVANGLVQTIMVKDAAGKIARVFIDGYITTGNEVKDLKEGCSITVVGVSSFDDTFNAPDGPFPRIRVKDRADVVCTEAPETDKPGTSYPGIVYPGIINPVPSKPETDKTDKEETSKEETSKEDKTETDKKETVHKVEVSVVTDFAIKAQKKAVKFTWEPVTAEEVTGYQIFRYNPKTKKYEKVATIKDGDVTEWKDKGLKRNKKYKYKIKAYLKTDEGKQIVGKAKNITVKTK